MEKNISIYVIRPTICFEEGDCYIGSTKHSIEYRFKQHKSSFNNGTCYSYSKIIIEKYGFDCLEIVELEKCCENERYERERYWIEKIKCVNKNVAGRGSKESKKNWRTKNPDWWKKYQNMEKYKEYKKNYNKRDYVKQKVGQSVKEYYQQNKEKISEKFNCECSGKYTYSQKTTHFKSKIHQDFLNNGIVITQNINESFKCDCGGKYTKQKKSSHFKTKLHQTYIENNNIVL